MQVFLYISLRKRVMGCVFAEGITQVQEYGMTLYSITTHKFDSKADDSIILHLFSRALKTTLTT